MDDIARDGGAPQKAGVLLVHGIGDIEAGAVAAATVDALAARPDGAAPVSGEVYDYPAVTEMRRLEESAPAPGAKTPDDYPYILRRARTENGREAVFAELFWSDVKSIDARKVQPLFLFLGSLLQAHQLIDALLAGRRDPIASLQRPLLLAGAYLLRGPIVGLNACLMITLLAIKYCAIAQNTLGFQMEGFWFVLGGLAFSALIGGILISKRLFRAPIFVEIGWAALIIALAGFAGAGAWAAESGVSGFNEFAFFARSWFLLGALWLAMAVIAAVSLLLLAIDLATFFRQGARRSRRSALLALGVLIFQAILWSTVMRIIWLTLGGDLKETIDLGRLGFMTGAEALKTLQFSVLLNIVSLAAVLLAVVVLGLLRAALTRGLPLNLIARGKRTPRLLVSPAVLLLVVLTGVGGLWATLAVGLGHGTTAAALKAAIPGFGDSLYGMLYEEVLPWLNQNALEFAASSLVVASPAALVAFRRVLVQGSFLLQDIIDYQPDGPFARKRAAQDVGADGPAVASAARRRIDNRLDQVVRDLTEREKIDLLVIVAHSQGSVIVYDLLPEVIRRCEAAGAPVKIITLGSPLAHIYAHYFEEYEGLGGGLDRLGPVVLSWWNFWRVDDAIGTRLSDRPTCFVQEHALPRGGHSNYWREPPVSDAILEAIADRAPSRACD